MSDKVRYYLEQSVSELQDLKKRGVFNETELQSIVKRRTEYEHRLVARTVKPAEFIAYAKYETNLDKLRAVRVKRLKKSGSISGSGSSDWAGPRRITFIYDRATKRFPANLDLWTRLVDFAKGKNSVHVVNKALTSMLRLHPSKPEVWVYVAKYQAEENAAIQEARAVLQRGLRFNPTSQYLWLEYVRLELIYVAKILARRKLLGIVNARKDEQKEQEKQPELDLNSSDLAAAEQELKNLPEIDVSILGDASSNPALRGDVALVVFDAAVPNFPEGDRLNFCKQTLELFDQFTALDRQYLCKHVIEYALQSNFGTAPEPSLWSVTLPVRHTVATSSEFPDQLRLTFSNYTKLASNSKASTELRQLLREYLSDEYLSQDGLDSALRKAIEVFINRL